MDSVEPFEAVSVPDAVARLLDDGEVPLWHVQPIRHANGRGVWLVMALGVLFTAAGTAALVDVLGRFLERASLAGLVPLSLALLFVAFSLVLLVWPLLSYGRMRRTHVLVTDRRVLAIVLPRREGKAPRVRAWAPAECTDLAVVRRRGASATLVLRERVRERLTDGQRVYEWEALHGLPDAERALAIVRRLRGEAELPTS